MQKYLKKVKDQIFVFKYFNISHIPRAKNAWADTLSRLTVTTLTELGRTYIEYLDTSSIEKMEEVL